MGVNYLGFENIELSGVLGLPFQTNYFDLQGFKAFQIVVVLSNQGVFLIFNIMAYNSSKTALFPSNRLSIYQSTSRRYQ